MKMVQGCPLALNWGGVREYGRGLGRLQAGKSNLELSPGPQWRQGRYGRGSGGWCACKSGENKYPLCPRTPRAGRNQQGYISPAVSGSQRGRESNGLHDPCLPGLPNGEE